MTSFEIPAEISTRLLQEEEVLWWGRPSQGLMLTPRDGLLIPFSLIWGGFAIFWEMSVLSLGRNAPFPFALFGIPFVCIGLFLIAGRFFLDSWLRSRTVYALTDRRVLIVRSAPWPSFQAISLNRLPEATINEGSNGRGTIRFGAPAPAVGFSGRAGWSLWVASLDPTPQFLSIEDAQRVFAVVQERSQSRLA